MKIGKIKTALARLFLTKAVFPIYIPYFGGFSWIFKFHKNAWMQNALNPVFKDKEFELNTKLCLKYLTKDAKKYYKENIKLNSSYPYFRDF